MMKKVVSVLLVVLLIAASSIAFATNFSSMTDEQLKEQLNAIRNELMSRGLIAENKTIILDQAGIQIYINSAPTIRKTWSGNYLDIPVVIVNNSGKSIAVMMTESSVNGWTTSGSISGKVPMGKKAKTTLEFNLEDTDVESIEDFTDVEFALYVYNNDDWFGDKVIEQTKPITIYASQVNN